MFATGQIMANVSIMFQCLKTLKTSGDLCVAAAEIYQNKFNVTFWAKNLKFVYSITRPSGDSPRHTNDAEYRISFVSGRVRHTILLSSWYF